MFASVHIYFVASRGEELCSACIDAYMSVCPLAYLKNHTSEFLVIFCICYLRSWLIPSLMTVKYVIYLWFCG